MALVLLRVPLSSKAIHAFSLLDFVPVQDQGTVLVGHHHVEHAPVEQVGEGDPPAVVPVGYADGFRHVVEASVALSFRYSRDRSYPDRL